MSNYKVFVDGHAGTTGLQIHERLAGRSDLELLRISEEQRKDLEARRALLNEADVVFLCLPDSAAQESASLVVSEKTRIIDASTAHRTDRDWVYGLPELSKEQRREIRTAKRLANPGCHATGFILPIYPLVQQGAVPRDYPITVHSVTGYSGGGKKLIEQYETADLQRVEGPRHYALGLKHKHLPEMQQQAGLVFPPHFAPIVGNFYRGMTVAIPLLPRLMSKKLTAKDIHEILAAHYQGEHFVRVMPFDSEANLEDGYFNPEMCNNTNRAEIFVFGHQEQVMLLTRLDNLGKGASGAAIQNMNIMLGIAEETGLE